MANTVGTTRHHIGFLDHFSKLVDPRQINKSLYCIVKLTEAKTREAVSPLGASACWLT